MTIRSIRVLVVEDSQVERELLLHILSAAPLIGRVTVAVNGEEAVEAACRERPDVVTMDIHMPKLDGVEATRRIMERCPVPIVVISASEGYGPEGENAFRALEAGALALVRKPAGIGHPSYREEVDKLLQAIELMSEVKVVRRWSSRPAPKPASRARAPLPLKLVAIGASAGGPLALQCLLSGLPRGFPLPLLIVQHLSPGFAQGFAAWLQGTTGFPVEVAVEGEQVLPGHAYLAPDGAHLGVAGDRRIVLSREPPDEGLRPSVAHLFRSVGRVFGADAVGVLLSGMGRDGAVELKSLKDRGALTLVQDGDSALINGMPGEAASLGGASHVLPPERIAGFLADLASKTSRMGDQRP